jgi:hypothetical protein
MMHGALPLLSLLAVIFFQPASSFLSQSSSPAAHTTLHTRFRLQSANAVSGSGSGSISSSGGSKKSLLIWDCDGVLVDSEALLKQGEVEALAAAGITLSVGTYA